VDDKQIQERLKAQDAFWNGPRYHLLLAGTLVVALAVIYFIAAVRTGNYAYDGLAHSPERELPPSGW
jgi:hypothetical protein